MRNVFLKILIIVLLITSLFAVTGCNQTPTNETITITDMVNDVVEVPKNPKKVACVSRTTYDLLIAYGLGDKIDGVYDKVLDNEWTSIFYPNSSNHYAYKYENSYELFISRGVDLVFAPEKRIAEDLRNHGICAITVNLYGTPTFDNYVTYLSDFCKQVWDGADVKAKADAWNNKVGKAVSDIQIELAKHEVEQKTLFYVRGDKDRGINYTDTIGSYTEYAYRMLGFNCLSASLDSNSNRPSAEKVTELNPDVFVMGGIFQNKHIEDIKVTEPYKNLDAVKNNKLYTIPMGLTQMEQLNALTPGFFYDQANRLYPDIFNFDVESMIKASVKEYFGTDLSNEQVYYMLNGLSSEGGRLY